MSVNIDPDSNQYDLAELRMDDETIICEDFSFDIEAESEPKTATNSRDPIGYKSSKTEYSFEANGISPEYYNLLREYQIKKTSFTVYIFSIGDDGDYHDFATFTHCRVNTLSVKSEDEGMSIDMEGVALSMLDAKK